MRFSDKLTAKTKKDFVWFLGNNPDYQVVQISGDDDVTKVWRIGEPGNNIYAMYLSAGPNCLAVCGDTGHYMWQRCYDMIPFLRGAIHSPDYFSEKVPHNIDIRCFYAELVYEWLDDRLAEIDEDADDESEAEARRAELQCHREAFEEEDCFETFRRSIYDGDYYNDPEGIPSCKFYTTAYLRTIETMAWFIKKLDAGEVVKQPQSA